MPIDITNKEEKQIALTGAEIEETLLQAHLSKDALEKIGEKGFENLVSSASKIDNSIMLVGNIRNYVNGSGGDETAGIKSWLLSGKSLASDENTYIFSEDLVVPTGVIWYSNNTTFKAIDNWSGNKVFNDMICIGNNTTIIGKFTLDGNADAQGFDKTNYLETGNDANGWNIYMLGIRLPSSKNIFMDNVEVKNVAGTGFSIGKNGEVPQSINILKLKVNGCWNAGGAIINGRDININKIESYSNRSNSFYAQNGFDIEANRSTEILRNIRIGEIVTDDDHIGLQIMQKTLNMAVQGDISIGKISHYSGVHGTIIERGCNIDIGRVVAYGNTGVGFEMTQNANHITIGNMLLESNNYGLLMDFSGIQGISSSNIKIGNVVAKNNTFRGISAQPQLSAYKLTGLKIDNYYTSGNGTYGIQINSNVDGCVLESGTSLDAVSVNFGRGFVGRKKISWKKTISFGLVPALGSVQSIVSDEELSTLDTSTTTTINSTNLPTGLILKAVPSNGSITIVCMNTTSTPIQADGILTRAVTQQIN